MGEAKRRGAFESRKAEALRKNQEQKLLEENLVKFVENKINTNRPRILQFCESIEKSLKEKNYFAALITSLTIPDICCSLEDENRRTSGKKYAIWFDKYVGDSYRTKIGMDVEDTIFLSGKECFALRCTYLHKGFNQIEDENIVKDYLNSSKKIEFMAETNSDRIKINGILILNLEFFCTQIISGVNKWLIENKMDLKIKNRMLEIPEIFTQGFSPIPGIYIGN